MEKGPRENSQPLRSAVQGRWGSDLAVYSTYLKFKRSIRPRMSYRFMS